MLKKRPCLNSLMNFPDDKRYAFVSQSFESNKSSALKWLKCFQCLKYPSFQMPKVHKGPSSLSAQVL